MTLTKDTFGRVVTTHMCPECGGRFLSAADCRPCPANGFAHPEPVAALPIYGCDEPPDQAWAVALPVLVMAHNEEQAYEMAQRVIEDFFPKRVAERYGDRLHPMALESREAVLAALPTIETSLEDR